MWPRISLSVITGIRTLCSGHCCTSAEYEASSTLSAASSERESAPHSCLFGRPDLLICEPLRCVIKKVKIMKF
jgi:hypothetical protein